LHAPKSVRNTGLVAKDRGVVVIKKISVFSGSKKSV
jgi:hypothetical protein